MKSRTVVIFGSDLSGYLLWLETQGWDVLSVRPRESGRYHLVTFAYES